MKSVETPCVCKKGVELESPVFFLSSVAQCDQEQYHPALNGRISAIP